MMYDMRCTAQFNLMSEKMNKITVFIYFSFSIVQCFVFVIVSLLCSMHYIRDVRNILLFRMRTKDQLFDFICIDTIKKPNVLVK
jgi:uncharacterized membrane protein YagU involved in acid resistance